MLTDFEKQMQKRDDTKKAAQAKVQPPIIGAEERGAPSPGRRRLLGQLALGTLALSASGAAYGNQVDDLEVIQCEVFLPGWPESKDGYKIGQVTDMHCDNAAALARVKRAVAQIIALQPDVAVITGDYASEGCSSFLGAGVDALRPLAGLPGGAFAIMGNHDFEKPHRPSRAADFVVAAGIHLLRNKSAAIPGVPNAYFVGLDDILEGRPNLKAATSDVPASAIRILLVHEPDYADQVGPGFSLQISGHSHGGQVRIPGLPPLHEPSLGRRYPQGLQVGPYNPVYTSKGVGVTAIPLRLYCRPDVTLITLRSA